MFSAKHLFNKSNYWLLPDFLLYFYANRNPFHLITSSILEKFQNGQSKGFWEPSLRFGGCISESSHFLQTKACRKVWFQSAKKRSVWIRAQMAIFFNIHPTAKTLTKFWFGDAVGKLNFLHWWMLNNRSQNNSKSPPSLLLNFCWQNLAGSSCACNEASDTCILHLQSRFRSLQTLRIVLCANVFTFPSYCLNLIKNFPPLPS